MTRFDGRNATPCIRRPRSIAWQPCVQRLEERRRAAVESVGCSAGLGQVKGTSGGLRVWTDLGRILLLWAMTIRGSSESILPVVPESSSPNQTGRVPSIEPVVQEMYTQVDPYFFHLAILVPRSRPLTRSIRELGNYDHEQESHA